MKHLYVFREHWYLIIVCNPGFVLSQKRRPDFERAREKQQKTEGQGSNPFLMILDSLSGTHSTASNKIRSYLQFEHLEKKTFPLTFGRDKMDEKHPEIPLQPNSNDCGVFLLHYVELIFKNVSQFIGAKIPDLSKWFAEREILYKRYDIACLIRDLSWSGDEHAPLSRKFRKKFPHIRFPAKRPKRDDPRLIRANRTKRKSAPDQDVIQRAPRTPPYPPPPSSDSSENEEEKRTLMKRMKGCSVITKRLEDDLGETSRLHRHLKKSDKKIFKLMLKKSKKSPNQKVIHSKSEMFKELMKGLSP